MQSSRLVALVVIDATVLIACAPSSTLVAHLFSPRAWVGTSGADHAAAELTAAALWLIALWLAVGVAACALTALPGVPGRAARALVRAVLPRAVRRVVAGAVGAGVVLSPAFATAATADPPGQRPASVVPAPAWPTDNPLPAPRWPATAAQPGPASSTPTSPSQHGPRPVAATKPHPHHGAPVTVRPGDTLWGIAAAQLQHGRVAPSPRRVATEWPRWYAANRAVIGSDADHIVPGQTLHAPVQEEQS